MTRTEKITVKGKSNGTTGLIDANKAWHNGLLVPEQQKIFDTINNGAEVELIYPDAGLKFTGIKIISNPEKKVFTPYQKRQDDPETPARIARSVALDMTIKLGLTPGSNVFWNTARVFAKYIEKGEVPL